MPAGSQGQTLKRHRASGIFAGTQSASPALEESPHQGSQGRESCGVLYDDLVPKALGAEYPSPKQVNLSDMVGVYVPKKVKGDLRTQLLRSCQHVAPQSAEPRAGSRRVLGGARGREALTVVHIDLTAFGSNATSAPCDRAGSE